MIIDNEVNNKQLPLNRMDTLSELVNKQINDGLYQEVSNTLDQLIALVPDEAGFYYCKGFVLHKHLDQIIESLDYYNKAITLRSSDHTLYANLGQAYTDLHKYHHALETFNQLISLDHKCADGWLGRVNSYSNLGRYEEAISAIEPLLTITNDNTKYHEILLTKGRLLINIEQYHQALEIIDQVIEKLPNFSSAYLTKIIAHYFSKDYQASIDCAELALSNNIIDHNDLLFTLDYLSESHLRLTNYQEAIEYSDQLLASIANSGVDITKSSSTSDMLRLYKSATECKALSLLNLGNIKAATNLTNKLLEIDPHYEYILVIKARLLNLQGKYQEATEIAEQALKSNASDANASYPLQAPSS